ncbi:agrin isoform X5 [Octopus sinensis]|uniref:Agrin isoform X5 n=1 Tax=Octopus sinensis TaxID=2607531 RepID=A0A7E6EVV0_9MOLL|nr:agrin isoform X5 [Octopus sinensis]
MGLISLKFFCSLSQNVLLLYLLYIISFDCVVAGLMDSDSCKDNVNIKTKIDMSNLVISGTIEKMDQRSAKNGMYDCEVLVGQVFKEDDRVPPNLMVDSDSMVKIKGFGSTKFCNSEVEPKDTKLFFLKTNSKAYKLIAGILPITFSNLKHITAVSKGQKYTESVMAPKKNPCDTHFCAFGAECHVNNTIMKPYCRCIEKCDDIFSPVCGSDLVSYTNECNLKRESCLKKKRIKVLIAQQCGADMKDPCEQKKCSFGAECVPSLDGFSYRCQCPNRCNTYGDNIGSTPVCGNDGVDYSNMCEMRKAACQEMKDIRVKYYGKCDPCDGFICSDQTVCLLDDKRKPVCRCNLMCSLDIATVCGTDGITYSNDCYLRTEACKSQRDIKVYHHGSCKNPPPGLVQDEDVKKLERKLRTTKYYFVIPNLSGTNPCANKCRKYERCNINRQGVAECVCPTSCEPVLRPICGSDGVTYDNECQLQKDACQNELPIILKQRGPCGVKQPCLNHHCNFHGVCVVREGRAECDCPTCSEEFDPVCGMNGISYTNECKLRLENCQKRSDVKVKHKGLCNGCENQRCEFYAVCQSDGKNAKCVCPSACVEVENKVCGTNRITYQNECELKVASCRDQKLIEVESRGDCNKCAKIRCPFGSTCENGMCVCPSECPADFEVLCASNGQVYNNECEMKRYACLKKTELYIVNNGPCDEISGSGIVEGSGSGSICDETSCKFGGTCELSEGSNYHCTCKNSCDAIRSIVCGSDGKTYGNDCMMKLESCYQQQEITAVASENCEDLEEEPCDGNMPLVNPLTGQEYYCYDDKNICPAGSYCHKRATFAKCCREGSCQCNPLGSYGTSCDPHTRQCVCKPGVGGLRCDRCKPGNWGLLSIVKGSAGCIPCNCNRYGSVRDDCEQNSGRCMCKNGITGMKCNVCPNRMQLGPQGCTEIPPKSCQYLHCKYGAICKHIDNQYQCVCDINCSGYPDLVCGSDNQTYGSECQLKQFSCRLQQPISIEHKGVCSLVSTESRMVTSPTPTTRSRKTTRHINHVSNEVTKIILTKATERPPEVVGRIDDLCPSESDCDVPNSRCVLGICVCKTGFIQTMDKKNCLEVVSVPPPSPTSNTTCTLNPCQNGGTCLMDKTLGYRCLCPLGTGGSICKDVVSFTVPSFSGTSYLRMPQIKNATTEMRIEVEFKSLNKDGIILFNSKEEDGSGDFVSLTLNQGFVELRYDLGNGQAIIRSARPIRLNKYHHVIARRIGQDGFLQVDGQSNTAESSSPGDLTSLNLDSPLYLGHIQNFTSLVKSRIDVEVGLVGCIRKVIAGKRQSPYTYRLAYPDELSDVIDGVDIAECGNNPCSSMPCKNGGNCLMLDNVMVQCICQEGFIGKYCENEDMCINNPCQGGGTCTPTDHGSYVCICPEDRKGRNCQEEVLQRLDVPEFNGTSYIELPLNESDLLDTMTIAVWFKTTKPDGMLFYASQYSGGEGDFIALNLENYYVEFSFNLGGGTTKVRSSQRISLDSWHNVVIKRHHRTIEMIIDNEKSADGKSDGVVTKLNLAQRIFIGGFRDIFDVPSDTNIEKGLNGAIQRVYINDKLYDNLITDAIETKGVTKYKGPPCKKNPCLNGGICVPKLHIAECRCHKQFTGHKCQNAIETKSQLKFEGDTFLAYLNGLDHKKTSQQANKFRLRFKSKKRSGLLFIMNQGNTVRQDYFAVALVKGKMQLSYNLGAQTEENLHIIRSTLKIKNNEWHVIEVERNQEEGILRVDDAVPIKRSSLSGATKLDTDGELWIGGKKNLPMGLPKDYYVGFEGCMDFVEVDDQRLNLVSDRKDDSSPIAYCS